MYALSSCLFLRAGLQKFRSDRLHMLTCYHDRWMSLAERPESVRKSSWVMYIKWSLMCRRPRDFATQEFIKVCQATYDMKELAADATQGTLPQLCLETFPMATGVPCQ